MAGYAGGMCKTVVKATFSTGGCSITKTGSQWSCTPTNDSVSPGFCGDVAQNDKDCRMVVPTPTATLRYYTCKRIPDRPLDGADAAYECSNSSNPTVNYNDAEANGDCPPKAVPVEPIPPKDEPINL